MGHITDDKDYDEFMGASADEWSKPEEPAPIPDKQPDETNRCGAVQPDPATADAPNRWGSESSSEPTFTAAASDEPDKKGKSKWWIILIVVVVVLCLCACAGTVWALVSGVINLGI